MIQEVTDLPGHTNEVFHVTLQDGRNLIVKQAHRDWARPRFESARRAAGLLEETPIVTPTHLHLPNQVTKPIQAYWYISRPTLKSVWPDLSRIQRTKAIQSLGQLLNRVHRVEVQQFGALNDTEYSSKVLNKFLQQDLQQRLRPAVWTKWKEGLPLLDRLSDKAAGLPEPERSPCLVHNDLHLDNILCTNKEGEIQCVGLLDLEASGGGCGEADLASAIELHDPLFDNEPSEIPGEHGWVRPFQRHLLEGYEKKPKKALLLFYRGYHLLNMGFYSAYKGDKQHADQVAGKIRKLLDKG